MGGPQDAENSSYNSGMSLIQQQPVRRRPIVPLRPRDRPEGRARRRRALLEGVRAVQARQERRRLATIARCARTIRRAAYLNDAKVLEADVRKRRQPVNRDDGRRRPQAARDPGHAERRPSRRDSAARGRADATNSLRVKKQALYVLALSDQPRAHQILLNYAKGARQPGPAARGHQLHRLRAGRSSRRRAPS